MPQNGNRTALTSCTTIMMIKCQMFTIIYKQINGQQTVNTGRRHRFYYVIMNDAALYLDFTHRVRKTAAERMEWHC